MINAAYVQATLCLQDFGGHRDPPLDVVVGILTGVDGGIVNTLVRWMGLLSSCTLPPALRAAPYGGGTRA
jgi:hypothetical protein